MHPLKTIFLSAALGLALGASAQEKQPLPTAHPLDAAIARATPDTYARAEVREVSPRDAENLLKSTAGPNWHVLEVRSAACATPVAKEMRKACREISNQCNEATKLANKYRAEISCSALYQQTTVVLTTVPTPKKGAHKLKKYRVSKHSVSKAPARSPGKEVGTRTNCN